MARKMSKTLKKILLCTALIAISQNASAFGREGKGYSKIDIGYGMNHVKRDFSLPSTGDAKSDNRGLAFSVGGGKYFLDELRLGFSVLYTSGMKGKLKNPSISGLSGNSRLSTAGLFIDGYYDLLTGSGFNPYLGLGVGLTRTELKDSYDYSGTPASASKSKTKLAYKINPGLSYHINTSIDLDMGYTFIYRTQGSKKNGPRGFNMTSATVADMAKVGHLQMFTLGLRYTF